VDAREPVADVTSVLLVSEPRVQADVLDHRDVGVEPESIDAELARVLLGEAEQGAADAGVLMGGVGLGRLPIRSTYTL